MTSNQISDAAAAIFTSYSHLNTMAAPPSLSDYLLLREEAIRELERGVVFHDTSEEKGREHAEKWREEKASGGPVMYAAAAARLKTAPQTPMTQQAVITQKPEETSRKSDYEILRGIQDEWN